MGNVGLSVGYVTKLWRVDWEDAGEERAPSGAADPSGDASEQGLALRRAERRKWCETMASCDPEGKLYHWIMVRHFESGKVAVFVDGAFEGTGTASFSSCELKYRVGNRVASTRIGFNEGAAKFAYSFSTCLIMPNGATLQLKEINETLMSNHDPSVLDADVTAARLSQVQSRSGPPGVLKPVVLYEVQAQVKGGEVIVLQKRFSEFVELDRLVRSAFATSHLLSSLPTLPPRQIKALADHTNQAFIVKRRMALSAYLRKLAKMPRIPCNPDVLEFLGILPQMAPSNVAPEVVV
ncbi:Hypothetical Protein FCC1311_023092 [Hondaea fermentalgiana]|uniref:PX domain-containing protein n=1 Tax=Hondaea fermentalgiana TaxID=2315210 RepID=A0A2R5G6Z6_9STRA|nr:Hypothetical Protein FCC1311_023092 [Hondaea fermentalgiana]|eukprot:GBG26089.1 Hypothetical Protein FCC1311_023092 [Hondaea fermentalgiana]